MKKYHVYLLINSLSFLFLLLFFSGCFSHCYRARPLQLIETDLQENVSQAFSSQSVEEGEWIGERWWEFFKDPQLSQLIDLSLACHPDIKVAEARILLACHQAMEARSILYPYLYLFGDVFREKLSELALPFVPGVPEYITNTTLRFTNLSYELDIWKKNRSLYYAALDEMHARSADWEEVKLLLSTAIASAYFDLQMNLERINVTRERLTAREELYVILKQQFDFGIISEFNLFQVDTEVQRLKDLLAELEGAVEIDKHAVAALVGNATALCCEKAPTLADLVAQFDQPFPMPATLPIDLLARRPDITAQKWRIEGACYNIQAAKARFFPQIDLRALIGVESIKIGQLFTGKAVEFLAGASGLLPIFTAGQLRAQLGFSQESLEVAIQTYNQLILKAIQEVSDALTHLQTSDKRLQDVVLSIQDASALYDLTSQRFTQGIDNKVALLNAIENLLVQQDLKVQVKLARFESAVELIQSIGGGYYD